MSDTQTAAATDMAIIMDNYLNYYGIYSNKWKEYINKCFDWNHTTFHFKTCWSSWFFLLYCAVSCEQFFTCDRNCISSHENMWQISKKKIYLITTAHFTWWKKYCVLVRDVIIEHKRYHFYYASMWKLHSKDKMQQNTSNIYLNLLKEEYPP